MLLLLKNGTLPKMLQQVWFRLYYLPLISDAKFEDKLIALGIDKDGKKRTVATKYSRGITSLMFLLSSITDLNGIQDFCIVKKLEL
jgi:hypothetical protein